MKRFALALIAFLFCVPALPAGSNAPNGPAVTNRRKPINLGRTSLAAVDASSVSDERGIDNVWYGALNAFDDGHNRLDRRQTYWRTAQEDHAWVELHFDAPVTVTSIEVDGDTAYHAEFTREDGGEESRGVVPGQAEYQAAVERVRRVRVTFDKEGANLEIEEVRVMGHPPAGARFTVDKPRLLVTPRTSGLGASDRFYDWYTGLWRSASRRFEDDGLRSIVTYTVGDTDVYRVIYSKADGQAIEETLADFTSLPKPRPLVEPPPIQLLPLSSVEMDAGNPTSFRFLAKELGGVLIERVRTVDLGLDVGPLLKVEYGGAPGDRRGCFELFAGNRTAGYWPVLLEQCHERSFRGDIHEYSYYVNDVDGDGRLEILPFEGRGEDAILETVYVFDPVTKVFGGAGWGGLSRENFENRRARGRFDATIGTRTPSLEERAKAPSVPALPAGSNAPNRPAATNRRKPINLGRTSLAAVDASSVNSERGIDDVWYGALNAFDDGHNPLDWQQSSWRTGQEDHAWVELHFEAPVTVTGIRVDGDTAYHAEFTCEDGVEETRGVAPRQAAYQAAVERVRRVRITFDRKGADLQIEEVRVMGHPPAGARFTIGTPRLLVTPRTSGLGAADRFNAWSMGPWRSASRRIEDDGLRSIVTYTLGDTDVYRVIYSKVDGRVIEETLADFTLLPAPRPKVKSPPVRLLLLSSLEKNAGDPTSFHFLEKEIAGSPIDRVRTVDLGLDVGSLLKVEYGGAVVDLRGCFALFAGNRTTGYWPVLFDECYERDFRLGTTEHSYYVNDVDGDGRLEILAFEGRSTDAVLDMIYVFDPVTRVFAGTRLVNVTWENVVNQRARGPLDATPTYRTPWLEERAKTPTKP